MLRVAFEHWAPGLAADGAAVDIWLASKANLSAGTIVSRQGERSVHPNVGGVEYAWRGVTMRRASHVHSLWHLARAQALADSLPPLCRVHSTDCDVPSPLRAMANEGETMTSFAGKVILITGATSGLGATAAVSLAGKGLDGAVNNAGVVRSARWPDWSPATSAGPTMPPASMASSA